MVGERWNLKQCYKRLRSKNVQWLVFLHGGPNYTITLYRSVLPTLNFPQSLLYNLGVHNISWLTAMQPSLELITLQLLSAHPNAFVHSEDVGSAIHATSSVSTSVTLFESVRSSLSFCLLCFCFFVFFSFFLLPSLPSMVASIAFLPDDVVGQPGWV